MFNLWEGYRNDSADGLAGEDEEGFGSGSFCRLREVCLLEMSKKEKKKKRDTSNTAKLLCDNVQCYSSNIKLNKILWQNSGLL